jgi:hypothetical protein
VPVQVAIIRYWQAESTGMRAVVHSDTPTIPHLPHITVHRAALTGQPAKPNFAGQRFSGPGLPAASGEGARAAWSRDLVSPRTSAGQARLSVRHGTFAPVKPALRPGLLPLWRDKDTVQIGIDPRRAVAISGAGEAAEVIRLLDGSRDTDQLIAEAGQRGVPAAVTERIIGLLATAGAVVDFPSEILRGMQPELRRQLTPVLATASLSAQDGDGGASLLARRSSCTVEVCGCRPVAALVADLLTRSGLAATAASEYARRASPPDLLVLVGRPSLDEKTELLRRRQPYLAVYAGEAIGVVGPLVRPGLTACLRCIDLAKAQRDPAWPLILAQLAGSSADETGCDAVLATSVAAQAAAQAIAFADRSQLPQATVNATLELVLPSWQWRRRSWLPHPACICGAERASQQAVS